MTIITQLMKIFTVRITFIKKKKIEMTEKKIITK